MNRVLQFIKKVRTAARLPWHEKLWFVVLYPLSGLVRAAILMVPFRATAPLMGASFERRELSPLVSEEQRLRAWRIGRICKLLESYTPWESGCLVQAILARVLLGYYGIPYVIHLGVMKSDDGNKSIKAHAWVRVGQWVISGREGHRTFTVLCTYVSSSLIRSRVDVSGGRDLLL